MTKLFDIYQIEQLKAIDAVLTKDDAYFYRKCCRWFSTEYSTPLKEVFSYPYEFVLRHYYEAEVDRMSFNDVYDLAAQEFVPELMGEFEDNNRKFAESLVKEQADQLKRKEDKESAKKSQSLEVKEEESNTVELPDDNRPTPNIKPIDLDFEGIDDEEDPSDDL